MKKALRDSKWYWYVPFIFLFCLGNITNWIFNPRTRSERHHRYTLSISLVFPTIIISFFILKYIW